MLLHADFIEGFTHVVQKAKLPNRFAERPSACPKIWAEFFSQHEPLFVYALFLLLPNHGVHRGCIGVNVAVYY